MIVLDKDNYMKIMVKLMELEIPQAEIAQKLNVTRQTVSQVIRGLCNSERVRKGIEEELKIKIWNIN